MLLLIWGLLIAADPVAVTPAPPFSPVLPAKKVKQRPICRTDPADTGSRMPRQLCMSAEQWESRAEGRSEADLRGAAGH